MNGLTACTAARAGERRVMFIKLTAATTPAQAIQMAYEFASALRATGWPPEDIAYARALWIGTEYSSHPLLAHLDAGFGAGYLGEPIPSAKDVAAANRNQPLPGSPDGREREDRKIDGLLPGPPDKVVGLAGRR